MQSKYARDGLAVVSLNMDEPRDVDAQQRALMFLKSTKATFTNLSVDPDDAPNFFEKLNIGGLPYAQIYDREGKLVTKFEGRHDAEIEELVTELLKKK